MPKRLAHLVILSYASVGPFEARAVCPFEGDPEATWFRWEDQFRPPAGWDLVARDDGAMCPVAEPVGTGPPRWACAFAGGITKGGLAACREVVIDRWSGLTNLERVLVARHRDAETNIVRWASGWHDVMDVRWMPWPSVDAPGTRVLAAGRVSGKHSPAS